MKIKSPFTGFWWLVFINLVAIIFLAHWWITEGTDWLRDGLLIGIFAGIDLVVIFTQRDK